MLDKITAALAWLNAEPGRKRAIATTAGIASVLLRHLDDAFRELCAKSIDVACGWRLDQFSDLALKVNLYIDGLAIGADATALLVGIPALIHAWKRQRDERAFFAPPAGFYRHKP